MEENKEKKKHSKRRHYRGRSNDKAKDPEKKGSWEKDDKKSDKAEKSEKKEKRDKPEKKEKRDRQGKKNRQDERKKPERKDLPTETIAEESPVGLKHEQAEVIFEFTWADAWGLYGTGYHIVIKDNPEKLYLSWSVDLSYDEIKIGDRLQEFLEDIRKCGVASWDGHRYTRQGIFDGDTWSVKINSLKIKCEAQGTNEYPPEWGQFLKCLHEKWKIPVSRREQWF